MTTDALLSAALRTIPLALCLPLPGVLARLCLGVVLASFALPPEAPLVALAHGVALGLGVGGPVWAARWAGGIVGRVARGPMEPLYATLAWLAFFVAGGPLLLFGAATVDPRRGTQLFTLAAQLALPSLLAFAIVEVLAGFTERVHGEARLGTHHAVRATRPLLAALLTLGGLASFAHGVAAALPGLR